MTKNSIKNYFIISLLLLSASSISQSNVFATPSTIDLGTASNFTVLAATTVTNTGNTVIAGNLGLNPGTSITGFPPGIVTGATNTADLTATQAQTDAITAYGALSRAACTTNESPVADIGGKTLSPGVYCFPSSSTITGTLTLSGSGVYIFKMGSTLVTAAGPDSSNVVLTHGATANNVFWQVGSSATLGTYSGFEGTIIALTSITANTGATVDGRLIALNGAVTLDSNTITVSSHTMADLTNTIPSHATADTTSSAPSYTMSYATSPTPSYTMADTIPSNFPCTVTFPTGAIDLGSNVQYPAKVYPPGVYCIDGAANIGSGPITLTGIGAHIFEINGALNQAANTDVILANGAQASSVIWVPTGAITIGANSHLIGTVNGAPITIGANSDINGIGPKVMADTIPGNFAILTSTYTNTSPGTSIAGDLGYTTGPAVAPTIDGITHVADSVYTQAGITQNAATSYANSQACTTNLGTTVDLSLVQGGVYAPGVYCTTGAASIGTAGITLSGNGVYIFEINGALTTVVHSAVTLSNGAQASSVTWVPTGATTLGANSNFAGTILDASGVTIGNTVSMTGRVLAFGGTVSTDSDTITVPSHTMADTISTVPEFGAITALIFTVAIVSIIAVSVKTRLRIMPKY
ncbi:MAG: ice-binding family protein [Nitrosotalea sp.]